MTTFPIILSLATFCAAACLIARYRACHAVPVGYGKPIRAEVLGTAPVLDTVRRPDLAQLRYVLVCGYVDPATGEDHRFRADGLAWEGRPPLPGSSVTVYVDPGSGYRDYRIDLDSLRGVKAVRPA